MAKVHCWQKWSAKIHLIKVFHTLRSVNSYEIVHIELFKMLNADQICG